MLSAMNRTGRTAAILIAITVVVSVAGQRLVGADFSPAAAHELAPAAETALSTQPLVAGRASVLEPVRGGAAAAAAETSAEAAEAPVSLPVTAAEPSDAPAVAAPAAAVRPA